MVELQGDKPLPELESLAESTTRCLQWREPGARRLSNASFTKLYREFLPMTVPPGRTLVSYVLRHSSGSVKVNSSAGQSCRIGLGGILLCGGPELQLLRGVVQHEGGCETIDLLVPSVHSPGVFAHLDDCYPTFVNSRHTCIRLLLGCWGQHRAMLVPFDGFWMLDIDIAPGAKVHLPVPGPGVVALLTTGTLDIDGRTVEDVTPLLLAREGGMVRLASASGASLLLFPQGHL
jgi:hypothetical protein